MATTIAPTTSVSNKPLAPLWHTASLLLLFFAHFVWGVLKPPYTAHSEISQEAIIVGSVISTIVEIVVLLYVFIGFEICRTSALPILDEAGRRSSVDSFLREIGLGVGAGCLLFLFSLGFAWSLRSGLSDPIIFPNSPLIVLKTPLAVLACFIGAVSAGPVEEIVCRGYLQKQFARFFDDENIAIVIQAAVFSMAHSWVGVFKQMDTFLVGLALGWISKRRKSVIAPIAAHATNNGIATILIIMLSSRL